MVQSVPGSFRQNITDRLVAGGQRLIHSIYPPCCIACNTLVDREFSLCPGCWSETPFITGLTCECCGTPLPGHSDQPEYCDDCLRTPPPWQRGRAALRYDGTARRLILAFKHGDRTGLARPMGEWLARAGAPLVTPSTIIAPVPLHPGRLFRRKYNQSALLSEAVARHLGACHCPTLFIRNRPTESQEGRSRDERFANLAGTISLRRRWHNFIPGRHIVIVDDVMTSGATLTAAALAAREAGAAQTDILCLARVAKDI